MSNCNPHVVYEGWLTKSPPSKRIWRAKWRRRWFALRQSGELPGQYFLDYYSDRNCRKLKGRIDLDLCEQVDAGLYMERGNSGVLGSRLRGSVFSVRTQARTYHLEADCEADMEKWVDAICRVCCLRADDSNAQICAFTTNNLNEEDPASKNAEPYIRISECITGARSQDSERPRAFTFDAQGIMNQNRNRRLVHDDRNNEITSDGSDNDSNLSEDDFHLLSPSKVVQRGPPIPPRPPKTFRLVKDGTHRKQIIDFPPLRKYTIGRDMSDDFYQQELVVSMGGWSQNPVRSCYQNASCSVPHSSAMTFYLDEAQQNQQQQQYCNLPPMPPAVDRALKPRHGSHSASHIQNLFHNNQGMMYANEYDWSPDARRKNDHRSSTMVQVHTGKRMERPDTLQYLDLDLQTPSTSRDFTRRKTGVSHVKSMSTCEDSESAYKMVDFLKTEAFNITRKDAEALRSNAIPL